MLMVRCGRLVPSGNEFTLEVTARQEGGVSRMEVVAVDTAAVLAHGGAGAEDLIVLARAGRDPAGNVF